ncbi:MAG: penicillin-binding protein [Firmicutes bacterium]|nr:penicillin-binding protein [Bacillota bacterium]
MKKIERRAIMCLLLAGALVIGLGIFCYKYITDGSDWAVFTANKQIYNNKGHLCVGTVRDANKKVLLANRKTKMKFSKDSEIRKALVHTTGDKSGNITTGVNRVFASKMSGYNILTGTYSMEGKGRTINLTVDSSICVAANEALDGRSGTVGVYNYQTGDIICLVSSPNFDPKNPPDYDSAPSGAYINHFFSSVFTPGSIFKLVTAAASIETKSDYASWEYTCTGSDDYGSTDRVTCQEAHGTVNLRQALADSCNCYFGRLSQQLGPDLLEQYTKKAGLTRSLDINGVATKAGRFEFPKSGINLAWTGIGQYMDLVNPCSMMVYMGAIANGGKAVYPKILDKVTFSSGIPASFPGKQKTEQMIEEHTASVLKKMMRNNVEDHYGKENFPDLAICAKSGTAEVGKDKRPNAWFVGFLNDDAHPYAFIVLIEQGGFGSQVAGSVANKVLQEVVDKY